MVRTKKLASASTSAFQSQSQQSLRLDPRKTIKNGVSSRDSLGASGHVDRRRKAVENDGDDSDDDDDYAESDMSSYSLSHNVSVLLNVFFKSSSMLLLLEMGCI